MLYDTQRSYFNSATLCTRTGYRIKYDFNNISTPIISTHTPLYPNPYITNIKFETGSIVELFENERLNMCEYLYELLVHSRRAITRDISMQ